MVVFRIVLAKYADHLVASGRAARWNSNKTEVIYTSSSQSLACLENVVHRNQLGLAANFRVLTIDIPDKLSMKIVELNTLPKKWMNFEQMHFTQAIGDKWINENQSVLLRVPSSIIASEYNFLINPRHPDFKKIQVLSAVPFVFDDRIKR